MKNLSTKSNLENIGILVKDIRHFSSHFLKHELIFRLSKTKT
jgi:hypothetical protein